MNANEYLTRVVDIISKSGDPNRDFFYLGGPMTGIPQFNFPRFKHVAELLRKNGYNIISPAELDDPETEAAALASPDGGYDPDYNNYLSRDLIVVSLPRCIGGIFLEGWHTSRGARGESWVLQFLDKQLFEFVDGVEDKTSPTLVAITHRDDRLRELDADPEGVPTDAPGERTAEARGEPQWVSSPGAVEVSADFRGPCFEGRNVGEALARRYR